MSKKSPAPWSYKKAKWEDGFSILDADGDEVTESGCGCCSPKDVGVWLEDDARLISAAPDLLAALEAMNAQVEADGYMGTTYGPLRIAAMAAIAKAKGESK
jgi:hypothetical protein